MNTIGIIPDCWIPSTEDPDHYHCTKHEINFYDYCVWCKNHPTDIYYVNVYEIDRRYGGPEEGGWWYDTGSPARHTTRHEDPRTTPLSFKLNDYWQAEALRSVLRMQFPHTGASSNVNGGEDYYVMIEPDPAAYFPTERPHYE